MAEKNIGHLGLFWAMVTFHGNRRCLANRLCTIELVKLAILLSLSAVVEDSLSPSLVIRHYMSPDI